MEVKTILLDLKLKRNDVDAFLCELKSLIRSKDFDIDKDFTLIMKHKPEEEEFSTISTLLDLEYSASDVVNVLNGLSVDDYSEAKIDKDDLNPPTLFIFGRIIKNKQVYIKLKIKKKQRRHVLVVSFHYAKHKMKFPFA